VLKRTVRRRQRGDLVDVTAAQDKRKKEEGSRK
jgi:hypothetical protein